MVYVYVVTSGGTTPPGSRRILIDLFQSGVCGYLQRPQAAER